MSVSLNNPVEKLLVDQIEDSPLNVRRDMDTADLELSLDRHGQLQPIIVRRIDKGRYQVVVGSRRLKAARALGWKKIEGRIRRLTNREALEAILVENNQRKDVHPVEEAAGFRELVKQGVKPGEIAEIVGRKPTYVVNRLKLFDLTEESMATFMDGQIPFSAAMVIARLVPDDQDRAVEFFLGRNPTIESFRRWIADNIERSLKSVPWPMDDMSLDPEAGSCMACPKTTKSSPTLFDDVEDDRCLDGDCFNRKHEAWNDQQHEKDPDLVNISSYRRKDEEWHAVGEYLSGDGLEDVPRSAQTKGILVDGNERGQVIEVCVHPDYLDQPKPTAVAGMSPKKIYQLALGVKDELDVQTPIGEALLTLAFERCGKKAAEICDDLDLVSTKEKQHMLLAALLVALRAPDNVLKEIGKDYGVKV